VTRPHRTDRGSVSALVAVVAVGLVMVAGLAYDGGQIVTAQATARDLAANAARAGAQEVDLDELRATGRAFLQPDRATAAAHDYLATTGHTATITVDGPTITVSVHVTQPMHILPLPDRTVTATDTATAATGSLEPANG
jgi:hypothetical protein